MTEYTTYNYLFMLKFINIFYKKKKLDLLLYISCGETPAKYLFIY